MHETATNITVVIPVFNRAEQLKACLDSIMAQTVRPSRVIVVDDGSTDSTAEVAHNHPLGVDVLVSPHTGATVARNIGLDAVITDWTMFFDSDDTMEPVHIANAVGVALDNFDLVGWDTKRIDPEGNTRIMPFEPNDIHWHNIMHGTLATQRYMARTDLFRRAGGWNPDAPIWNDIELGVRLLALTPRITKVSATYPTVNVFTGHESITGNSWAARCDRYLATLDILADTLNPANHDWLRLKTAILAADIARENAELGRQVYRHIRPRTPAIRFAYTARRAGFRGLARLLRPLFSHPAFGNR